MSWSGQLMKWLPNFNDNEDNINNNPGKNGVNNGKWQLFKGASAVLMQMSSSAWKKTCSLDNPKIKGLSLQGKIYCWRPKQENIQWCDEFLDSNSESYSLCDAQTDMSSDDDAVVVNKEVNEAVGICFENSKTLFLEDLERGQRERMMKLKETQIQALKWAGCHNEENNTAQHFS